MEFLPFLSGFFFPKIDGSPPAVERAALPLFQSFFYVSFFSGDKSLVGF